MADVILFNTVDGGEIEVERGRVKMDGGLATSVYISLFTASGWWGGEYSGHLLELIQGGPLTSARLNEAEDAARRDLDWLLTAGAANEITVTARVPERNRLDLEVQIDGEQVGIWKANWGER